MSFLLAAPHINQDGAGGSRGVTRGGVTSNPDPAVPGREHKEAAPTGTSAPLDATSGPGEEESGPPLPMSAWDQVTSFYPYRGSLLETSSSIQEELRLYSVHCSLQVETLHLPSSEGLPFKREVARDKEGEGKEEEGQEELVDSKPIRVSACPFP